MTAHKPITNSYSLRLNKSTDIWCNDRPVMGWQGLTVEQAAKYLNKAASELGPFLVATFKLTHHEDVPSIEKQIAAKRRRLIRPHGHNDFTMTNANTTPALPTFSTLNPNAQAHAFLMDYYTDKGTRKVEVVLVDLRLSFDRDTPCVGVVRMRNGKLLGEGETQDAAIRSAQIHLHQWADFGYSCPAMEE